MSWTLVSDDPVLGVRRYEDDLGDYTIVKTEFYARDEFFERNKQLRNESDGKRFGTMQRVASIPLHVWARVLAPAQKQGDDKYIRKWLNNSDNEAVRTFKGRV